MRCPPVLALAALLSFFACRQNPPATSSEANGEVGPPPTEIASEGEDEGSDQGASRERWIEAMHLAAPGIEWRRIEAANASAEAARLAKRGTLTAAKGGLDSIAPGLYGKWSEVGSRNLAGSVIATTYDPATDQLYTVSAGGTLWRGPSDGSSWEVVDQSRRYEQQALKWLERAGNAPSRLLAGVARQIVYSDDGGRTWQTSTGISSASNFYSGTWDLSLQVSSGDTTLYLLSTSGYYDDLEIYRSTDLGQRWTKLPGIAIGTRDHAADLVEDPGLGAPWLLSASGLARVTPDGLTVVSSPPNNTDRRRLAMGARANGQLVMYTYDTDLNIYRSVDSGGVWEQRGTLSDKPWSVGLFVNPSNPDELVSGAVNAAVSRDGGDSWRDINRWSDYYRDIQNMLHADMMSFAQYTRSDGSKFSISANHGGLYTTGNFFVTRRNIGLDGLNVGQFYSVVAHEQYPGWIFGGTQDQGFQRGSILDPTEPSTLEQAISGDYGHLSFTDNGNLLWMLYPGTSISYYANPRFGSRTASRTIKSEDESVWLAPMVAHPDESKNAVLVAGGSIVDDGVGSFLLQATADINNRSVDIVQLPYDFKAATGGVLTAVGASPLVQDRIYVATNEGDFMISGDDGQTWVASSLNASRGHYLYGQAIEASPTDANTVWLGGSGYSNAGVFRSTNAGRDFAPDAQGLPSTMVFELAASADGAWLFAATEAGPYALETSSGQWYPLALPGVPTQTFWSVDYVAEDTLVRFGTYGRGIWDLKLGARPQGPSRVADHGEAASMGMRLSPNPVRDELTVTLTPNTSAPVGAIKSLRVVDALGRQVMVRGSQGWTTTSSGPSGVAGLSTRLDVANWPAGRYVVSVQTSAGRISSVVVKQ